MTYTIPAMKANLKDRAAYKAQRKAVDDAWRNILAQPLQAIYFDDVCLSPATNDSPYPWRVTWVEGDTPICHVMLDSLEKAFWELRGYTGRTVTVVF